MQDSQLLAYFSDLQDVFPVSSNMDSCSNKAGKKEFPFIPIDTPGLNEPTPLKDSVIILEMAEEWSSLMFSLLCLTEPACGSTAPSSPWLSSVTIAKTL